MCHLTEMYPEDSSPLSVFYTGFSPQRNTSSYTVNDRDFFHIRETDPKDACPLDVFYTVLTRDGLKRHFTSGDITRQILLLRICVKVHFPRQENKPKAIFLRKVFKQIWPLRDIPEDTSPQKVFFNRNFPSQSNYSKAASPLNVLYVSFHLRETHRKDAVPQIVIYMDFPPGRNLPKSTSPLTIF